MQALFPNPDGILRPGLYAKVRAPTETVRGALLVPQRAVQETQGRTRSAVVGDGRQGRAPHGQGRRAGRTGSGSSMRGSQPGERVVTEGLQKVRDGIVVNTKPDTSAATAPAPPAQG